MSTLCKATFTSRLLQGARKIEPVPFHLRSNTCYSYCSDVGIYDRVVIQEILKEIAQTQQVDISAKQRFKGWIFLISLILPEIIQSSSQL